MQDLFHAAPLLPDEARLAYPLVRMFDPAVSLRDWLAFVRRFQRRKREQAGLMAVRDRREVIFALFSYAVEQDFRSSTCLRVSDLIVGYLPSRQVDAAILSSAQELADRLGCGALLIDMPVPPTKATVLTDIAGMGYSSFSAAAITFQRQTS